MTYDPEGLLSTLPAIVTVLIGVLCGLSLRTPTDPHPRLCGLIVIGLSLVVVGLAMNSVIPIAKKVCTDSFTFFVEGVAILIVAATYWITDVRDVRAWSYPFRAFGANAILAFALSQILGPLSDLAIFPLATGTVSLRTG